MQYCTKCGNAIEEGEEFCSRCGQPVKGGPVTAKGEPAQRTTRSAAPQSGGSSSAAIALGIVGIIIGFLFIPLIGIILGIIAIALGASASCEGDENGSAGVVLGVLALFLSIMGWVLAIVVLSSMW